MAEPAAKTSTLSVAALTALVVGSMVGGGIFSLPQSLARSTGALASLIAWAICGVGMLTLGLIFQTLSTRKPDLNAGVFAYARAGFGDYVGFLCALGYWAAACLGNVTFLVLYKSTLGSVIPAFGAGNTPMAVATSSVLLWAFHFLILRGVQQATVLNSVTTVAKIAAILAFIAIAGFAFDPQVFAENLWGDPSMEIGGPREQIRNAMYVTVFTFLGIESASVYSRYARKRSDVGRATVGGFLLVLALLIAVTVISFGILPQAELAELRNPSLALVLKAVVGQWGGIFIALALIISVLGAFLSWTLLAAEVLYVAGVSGSMPKFLARQNARKVPATALWLTNGLVQLFLLATIFAEEAYVVVLQLTSSMALIPYLLVAGYAFKLARSGETYEHEPRVRVRELTLAAIAIAFSIFVLYVGGPTYLLLSALVYAPGIVLFVIAKRERNERLFDARERLICLAIMVAAVLALARIVSGDITLG